MQQILIPRENGVLKCGHFLLSLMSVSLETISETCIFEHKVEGVHVLLQLLAMPCEVGPEGVAIDDQ